MGKLHQSDHLITIIIILMNIEVEIKRSFNSHPIKSHSEPLNTAAPYQQTKYRWVIVALTGGALFLNGIASNAIAPLENRMTIIYSVSEKIVILSITLSFIVFFLANFPANRLIDRKGIRFSICLGAGLYFVGFVFYLLINASYYLVIVGTIFMGIGQPFLINLPAKIASQWFYPKNVTIY